MGSVAKWMSVVMRDFLMKNHTGLQFSLQRKFKKLHEVSSKRNSLVNIAPSGHGSSHTLWAMVGELIECRVPCWTRRLHNPWWIGNAVPLVRP